MRIRVKPPQSKASDSADQTAAAQQEAASAADLAQALGEVTLLLEATAVQLGRVADAFGGSAPRGAAPQRLVNIYGDDPFSEASPTGRPPVRQVMAVPVKGLDNEHLRIAIGGAQPPLARHAGGTPDFRYWAVAEALARGIAFWSELLPQGTTWSAPNPLPVVLVAPKVELNAYYDRRGLRFHRAVAGGVEIYTAHSADVVCHELGHAILDALKPQLFNSGTPESWAFHEAFGDISALLSALELDWMCQTVLQETGGRLSASSRWSRIAESLGWGLRQGNPRVVEADCLRNAVNQFSYRHLDLLPADAPASQLSRRPHSFSRVFTGAFFDVLAGLLSSGGTPDTARLRWASREAGRLLVAAVHAAPIAADYFSQVGAAMIEADQALNGGRNRLILTRAFTNRGILSVESVMRLASAPAEGPGALGMAGPIDLGMVHLEGREPDAAYRQGFGRTPELPVRPIVLDGIEIGVHLPDDSPRFAVAPLAMGPGSDELPSTDEVGRLALEELIRGGRVELAPSGPSALRGILPEASEERAPRVTHQVITEDGKPVLRRLRFQCCPCAGQPLFCAASL